MRPVSLTGRTALVTGANRGLGLAVARRLAQVGAQVLVAARLADDAARAVEEVGHGSLPLTLDLLDDASIEAAGEALAEGEHEVDVLVQNAGVYPEGIVLGRGADELDDAFRVHVSGPARLARIVVPGMIERGFGRVVHVSSGYGSFAEGLAGPPVYAITKAALNAYTAVLASALERRGDVKVNAVCPGWVRTRMGGKDADRSPEEAAEGVVWAATLDADGPTGGFFRDGERIAW